MAWVEIPTSLASTFNITRYGTGSDCRVAWELIEYLGSPTGPHAIEVLAQGNLVYSEFADTLEAPAVPFAPSDDEDVAVFITGQGVDADLDEANQGLFTAHWDVDGDHAVLTRGADGSESTVSYAVVEYTGEDWRVLRIEHDYEFAGVLEMVLPSPPVISSRAFVHPQLRSGSGAPVNLGALVSIGNGGTANFELHEDADPKSVVSTAWIVEDGGSHSSGMYAYHHDGSQKGAGSGEQIWFDEITLIESLETTSIMGECSVVGDTGPSPLPAASIGLFLNAISSVELRRANGDEDVDYCFSVVEWPWAPLIIDFNDGFESTGLD